MSYSQQLFELPVSRLQEIIHRRAAGIRGIPRIADKRALANFLAEALSHRDSIHQALYQTDLLQLRVLTFAISHGGVAEMQDLVSEAGAGAADRLREAIDGLELLALAFRGLRGEHEVITVPPSVCQHTPVPLPYRFRLPNTLSTYSADAVNHIHETLDLPAERTISRTERQKKIVEYLTDREKLDTVRQGLSPDAGALFTRILENGSITSLYELAGRLEARQRNQMLSYDWSRRWFQGKPRNIVEELLSNGLLVLAGEVGWGYGNIVVPGDVLETIRSRSIFADVADGIPALQTIAVDNGIVRRHETLCRDITYLYGYLGRAEAAQTAKGTIHRSALKTIAKGLTITSPYYAGFVYAMAYNADLVDVTDYKGFYDVTEDGLVWLEFPYDTQLRLLYDTWRSQVGWFELQPDPLNDTGSYYTGEARTYRDCAITLLSDLARQNTEAMASLESMAAQAAYRWWQRFPPPPGTVESEAGETSAQERSVRLLQRICGESLFWLGLTEIRTDAEERPTHVRLSARGRRVFLNETQEGSVEEQADTFVVQPNLEIYAPPNLAPRMLYRLFKISEPTAAGMLMLSREMLRRALDRGESSDGLLRFLRKHSQTGVPQNVEYLIKEVGGRHGHIKIGQAGLYMQVSDPVLLKELMAQKNLKISFRAELADTVALITGDSVDSVLRQLRQAGYFPVAADEHEKQAAKPPRGKRTYRPPAESPHAAAPALDSRIDWKAIEASGHEDHGPSRQRPDKFRVTRDRNELVTLIQQAAEEHLCLEIHYQPDGRSETQRVIEPYSLNGLLVDAYCRLSKDRRLFNVRNITWAQLTGETFE